MTLWGLPSASVRSSHAIISRRMAHPWMPQSCSCPHPRHARLPVCTFSRRSAAINSRSLNMKHLVHAAAPRNGSRLAVGASHHVDDSPIWTPLSVTVRKRRHASAVITHQSRREPWTDQVALSYHVASSSPIASNASFAFSRVRKTVLPMSACSKIIWSESVV